MDIDYIISYLSPWIIPTQFLTRAKKASINFHTGPPKYPGIGCTNFAIYNQESVYGVTCHEMNPKVDMGQIIAVKRFNCYETDTVYSLTQKCYGHILSMFYEITDIILSGKEIPKSDEHWARKPYTRKELNNLCKITPDMPHDEIAKRVKAVTYPSAPGAYIEIDGMKFNYEVRNA